MSVHRSRPWYRSIALSIAIRPRLYFSALAGLAVFLLLPRSLALSVREALASIAGLLGEATDAPRQKILHLILAAITIVLPWMVTQVVCAFRYATEFYQPSRGDDLVGGLDFPSDNDPNYWDFFYFATSIGATSQTSDVSIRTKRLRQMVTVHAIISFFFNTAILALTINLAASLI